MGNPAKPAPEGPSARRSFVTLPLSQLLPALTRPAFKKRSPAGATLLAAWSNIVGPALAVSSEPRRLYRGQLTIACAGAVAMELQHLQLALINRINTHVGETLVTKLQFVQDHIFASTAQVRAGRKVEFAAVEGLDGALGVALAGLLQSIRERD
jgi:hypothetical protein